MLNLPANKKAPDYLEKRIFKTIDFYKSIKNISELIFFVSPKVFFQFGVMPFDKTERNNPSNQNK